MSNDLISTALKVGIDAGTGTSLYLLIRLRAGAVTRWNIRANRLADQHGETVVNRITAQLGRCADTAASTGMTRLCRRSTPDIATAETALSTVLDQLGLDTETTTTILAIQEPHPENACGVGRTPDPAHPTGANQPAQSRRREPARRGAGACGGPAPPP